MLEYLHLHKQKMTNTVKVLTCIVAFLLGVLYRFLGGQIIWIVYAVVGLIVLGLLGWLFLRWITTDDEGEEIR